MCSLGVEFSKKAHLDPQVSGPAFGVCSLRCGGFKPRLTVAHMVSRHLQCVLWCALGCPAAPCVKKPL